ncbi:MAG: hypothetical protein ACLT46_18080 [Hungatella sp.]
MVNDRYGHSFGDFCICSFSDILRVISGRGYPWQD